MSFLKDIAAGLAHGILLKAAAGARASPVLGSAGNRVEACCAQLGWSIDERMGTDGIILYFNDALMPDTIRKLLITGSASGPLAVFTVFSAGSIPAEQVPAEVLGHLLVRNQKAVFPAWQVMDQENGNAGFAVTYCALVQGLEAGIFEVICKTMCNEVHEFDAKLRQAGML